MENVRELCNKWASVVDFDKFEAALEIMHHINKLSEPIKRAKNKRALQLAFDLAERNWASEELSYQQEVAEMMAHLVAFDETILGAEL